MMMKRGGCVMCRSNCRALVVSLVAISAACGEPPPLADDASVVTPADDAAEPDAALVDASIQDGSSDAEAPAWPMGRLRTTPITSTSARLTWSAATDNVGVTG